jgi:hypothetical protein
MIAASLHGALTLQSPMGYQVFQRGNGGIAVRGHAADDGVVEARVAGGAWIAVPLTNGDFSGQIPARAGGFFAVDIRERHGEEIISTITVPLVGVGEVFVIAGQSNATNYGEERQQSRSRMVATFSGTDWRIADDPQPGVQDNSSKGSFIPAFGDALYEKLHVPIGIACVGHGSTSVRQWLPEGRPMASQPTMTKFVVATPAGGWQSTGQLCDEMLDRIRQLGPNGFRAILWHQGESDANQKAPHQITGADYYAMLADVIHSINKDAGWDIPWFVAQASYHTPDDTSSPETRAAQARLWHEKIAFEGPDTDALTSVYREKNGTGVHFNVQGLEVHGKLWADKIALWLNP